jgi:hypothetical protein
VRAYTARTCAERTSAARGCSGRRWPGRSMPRRPEGRRLPGRGVWRLLPSGQAEEGEEAEEMVPEGAHRRAILPSTPLRASFSARVTNRRRAGNEEAGDAEGGIASRSELTPSARNSEWMPVRPPRPGGRPDVSRRPRDPEQQTQRWVSPTCLQYPGRASRERTPPGARSVTSAGLAVHAVRELSTW